MQCCSLRFWSISIIFLASFLASLSTLMSSLLRHMFTSPNQQPWPHGSLRLINCTGLPAQTLYSTERIHDLNNSFIHQKDDVWVVSYVKSGTTWTIGILASLWNHPAAEYSGNLQKMTRVFCPQPELPDLGWGDDGFGHSMEELNHWPSVMQQQREGQQKQKQYRCFKSHWPNQDFLSPSKIHPNTKIIYVMRNAQDQMISHWNQVWGMGFHYDTQNKTFEQGWQNDFVQDWIDGNVEMGKWFDHVAGWYQRSKKDDNVLLIRYEDLKMHTKDTISIISQFVDGKTAANDETIAKIMEMTSFEKMREADEKDVGLRLMRWLGVLRKHHIRQGVSGSGELSLSKEQWEILEREYEVKLKPLGMPRDWVFLD